MYDEGKRLFYPSNDVWGDLEPGVPKTLTIKYQFKGQVMSKSAKEHSQDLVILPGANDTSSGVVLIEAKYGPGDIKAKVEGLYNEGVRSFEPSNAVWGDT